MSEITRIIIDSQSNRLFRGVKLEQNYDQRGGLCQVGEGHVLITTHPIDSDYLTYWQNLGFTLPTMYTVGPFNPEYTLSELIMKNSEIKKLLEQSIDGDVARLEFFCIEETEKKLANYLGIPSYCQFDLALSLSSKIAFKQVCHDIDLNTAPWESCYCQDELTDAVYRFLSRGGSVLVKTDDGTGGIACGGMHKISSMKELVDVQSDIVFPVIVERLIEYKKAEVSVHWEIDEQGQAHFIGIFGQLSKAFGYSGAFYPSDLSDPLLAVIQDELHNKLIPFLQNQNGLGYFCCDILIDNTGMVLWTDFNPRKGAILYVHDMTRRIREIHLNNKRRYFWHEHCYFGDGKISFLSITKKLDSLLVPNKQAFVVVTNPGVIPFGYVDITGISSISITDAQSIMERAKIELGTG